MKTEIKNLWLEALRSGDFEQTKGVLCTTDGKMCCLGVLTEMAVKAGIVQRGNVNNTYNYVQDTEVDSYTYGPYEDYGILPSEVMEWADLDSPNPAVNINGSYFGLAELNDAEDFTFPMIADVIEEHL